MYLLGALCAGAIAAGALVVGPPSQSAATTSRIVTVQRGVVQSTVSGSGNIQSATQLNLGFKTTGVVQHIYAHAGEHVTQGQLLAELDPQSTEVTLQQGRATLQAAAATLAQLEENEGESASGASSTGAPSAKTAALSSSPTASKKTTASPTTGVPTTASPTTSTATTPATTTPTTTEKAKQSAATREANLASAGASVKSDRLAVESDEQAVAATRLYAPTSGTIVSLSGEVDESVAGGGTTRAAGSEASPSSSAASSGAATTGRSSAGSTSSSSSASTSSSSSAFAVLSDLSSMQLVVPLSESEIVHIHSGQPATVTVEALEGLKLAARVVTVAQLATSNSGVVSYDVTFQLNQLSSELRPGMSATAEVVVKQAEGVNVPTSAISARSVTVLRKGARVPQRVVTGLAGNDSTIILSGLTAGEQIALPLTSSSSATSLTSRLAGRTGGGLGGGLGGGGGFPGAGAARAGG